ncbi:prepilin-type N-terminal cleavage/methylation domain-containing protein [Elusimicrobium posterum]|uniref:prepilin-type N-terminal cleavage/methylation domain-containing protein n=1 Tax=Elusimicrobium posterum TaxID=3116653 RepID=UPI003C745E12
MLNKKGFTLVELLVVIIIVAILAAIAVPQYTISSERSRAAEAVINAKAIEDSLNRYFMKRNTYPTGTTENILALLDNSFTLPKYFSVDITTSQGFASVNFYRSATPSWSDTYNDSRENYYSIKRRSMNGAHRSSSCNHNLTGKYCEKIANCKELTSNGCTL